MKKLALALALALAVASAQAQTSSTSVKPFFPNGSNASLTSTATSADIGLPGGSSVVVANTGTSAVSCNLTNGAGTSTPNRNIIQPASWFAFAPGSNTHISCVNQALDGASNVVVIAGGANLPTGSGGGGGTGGGGGGGTVTQGPASSNAGSWWMRLGDATNGPAAVKPAATAATTSDPALVVAVSPNGTVAATQSGNWSTRILDGAGNLLTSQTRGAQQPLSVQIVDGSGNQITSFGGAGGTASNFGSAFPTPGTAVGFSDGTNMQPGRIVSTGADASANTLNELVTAGFGYMFNGTTWDRMRGTIANGLATQVTNVNANGQATMANSSSVVIASDQSNLPANIKQINGSTLSLGQTTMAASLPVAFASNQSNLPANVAQINGSTLSLGQTAMASSLPVTIANNQSGIPVTVSATTTGGSLTSGTIMPNNTTAIVVKASAGTLYGVQLYSSSSGIAFVKFYNATSATCGSGTPVKRLLIPVAATASNGNGNNVYFGPVGVAFSTGITYCVTTGIADNDTSAPAANSYLVNVDYQ
jgi:hypothetical protein